MLISLAAIGQTASFFEAPEQDPRLVVDPCRLRCSVVTLDHNAVDSCVPGVQCKRVFHSHLGTKGSFEHNQNKTLVYFDPVRKGELCNIQREGPWRRHMVDTSLGVVDRSGARNISSGGGSYRHSCAGQV